MARSTLEKFSDRLIKDQALPNGFTIGLYHRDGRKARSNMQPERKSFKRGVEALDDRKTVHALLELGKRMFPAGSPVLKLSWGLYNLKGKVVPPGTQLGTVRAMEGAPTKAELDQQALEEQRADELMQQASGMLRDLEELEDDPSTTVCNAVVDALVDQYGLLAVRDALTRHQKVARKRG